ncbi:MULTISPECIES: hypothetical protein [Nocardia]|uniref:hypothetical protein n=1 Tax=Nocardia TaxID=1817 RepID=UPI001894D280|nr:MULTISPECIES: hypothetical protein [Nocardia]MBF6216115.1 hypothetical protein [Nocardia puris]
MTDSRTPAPPATTAEPVWPPASPLFSHRHSDATEVGAEPVPAVAPPVFLPPRRGPDRAPTTLEGEPRS